MGKIDQFAFFDLNPIHVSALSAKAFGFPDVSPILPHWVQAWAAAEQDRTWPPEF